MQSNSKESNVNVDVHSFCTIFIHLNGKRHLVSLIPIIYYNTSIIYKIECRNAKAESDESIVQAIILLLLLMQTGITTDVMVKDGGRTRTAIKLWPQKIKNTEEEF